jgi:hypothetical protein
VGRLEADEEVEEFGVVLCFVCARFDDVGGDESGVQNRFEES